MDSPSRGGGGGEETRKIYMEYHTFKIRPVPPTDDV